MSEQPSGQHEAACRWYALYVRSRHEKSVYAQLRCKDHEAFLPLFNSRHKWADRWNTVSLPLFPGYVFCRFKIANRTSVLTTSGVIDVVRTGLEPAPVPDDEIETIQAVVNSPLALEPYVGLAKGQRATMSDGPLKGLTGTVVEIKRNLRLVLSVELLHRSVLVEIERDWVVPLDPTSAFRSFG